MRAATRRHVEENRAALCLVLGDEDLASESVSAGTISMTTTSIGSPDPE